MRLYVRNEAVKVQLFTKRIVQKPRDERTCHSGAVLHYAPNQLPISWKRPSLNGLVINAKILDKCGICDDATDEIQVVADKNGSRRAGERCIELRSVE